MPHVVVKLWPGKSDHQKAKLAKRITQEVCSVLGYGEESVSVAFEEVSSRDWMTTVYERDIVKGPGQLFKRPGYGPAP